MVLGWGCEENFRATTITDLFRYQAANRPHEIAVTCGEVELSYADLDSRSDRVARWLVAHGVGAEGVVGVCGDRSVAVISALLGILKAGGAYLALDPSAPEARSRLLLAEASAVALIASPGLLAEVALDTLSLDDVAADGVVAGDEPDRAAAALPDGLAYVCFTSGSTGRPKGVCVPHRAVMRLAAAVDVEAADSVLHLAPLSFDASTFEIWAPLLRGGRIVIHPPGPVFLDAVVDTLVDKRVTTAWFTAGLFARLVDAHVSRLGGLRQVLAGGDIVSPTHVNRLLEHHPHIRFVNGYGPAENTTFTCCHVVSERIDSGSVPIGPPITGTRAYVLDEALLTVPDGSPGELYAAGEGLSRGYLGMPGHTAAVFLPDPFSGVPGSRMYRTGDAVRRLPDGGLAFLGRLDDQVKIRGFRVEPAEIETAIHRCPGVGQAVVVARDDVRDGERCLVAYLTADAGADLVAGDLTAGVRRLLRATLPWYAMPVAFLVLDTLPVTGTGKVDRAALPMPARMPRDVDGEFVPPVTPTEELLCDMWAEALGVDAVGVWDDFFQLGGNSLLAMDLVAGMTTVLRAPVSARLLLFHPTVAELAEALAAADDPGAQNPAG